MISYQLILKNYYQMYSYTTSSDVRDKFRQSGFEVGIMKSGDQYMILFEEQDDKTDDECTHRLEELEKIFHSMFSGGHCNTKALWYNSLTNRTLRVLKMAR